MEDIEMTDKDIDDRIEAIAELSRCFYIINAFVDDLNTENAELIPEGADNFKNSLSVLKNIQKKRKDSDVPDDDLIKTVTFKKHKTEGAGSMFSTPAAPQVPVPPRQSYLQLLENAALSRFNQCIQKLDNIKKRIQNKRLKESLFFYFNKYITRTAGLHLGNVNINRAVFLSCIFYIIYNAVERQYIRINAEFDDLIMFYDYFKSKSTIIQSLSLNIKNMIGTDIFSFFFLGGLPEGQYGRIPDYYENFTGAMEYLNNSEWMRAYLWFLRNYSSYLSSDITKEAFVDMAKHRFAQGQGLFWALPEVIFKTLAMTAMYSFWDNNIGVDPQHIYNYIINNLNLQDFNILYSIIRGVDSIREFFNINSELHAEMMDMEREAQAVLPQILPPGLPAANANPPFALPPPVFDEPQLRIWYRFNEIHHDRAAQLLNRMLHEVRNAHERGAQLFSMRNSPLRMVPNGQAIQINNLIGSFVTGTNVDNILDDLDAAALPPLPGPGVVIPLPPYDRNVADTKYGGNKKTKTKKKYRMKVKSKSKRQTSKKPKSK
tara:strand:+ start:11594 stop:13228 length:1635 start_codon:yes stop_codon:yes gene_type:complete